MSTASLHTYQYTKVLFYNISPCNRKKCEQLFSITLVSASMYTRTPYTYWGPCWAYWKISPSFWHFLTLFWSFWSISSDLLYFRDGILERHFLWRFLGINSILLRLEFSTLIFPFCKILFMNRLQFSCFANFLYLFYSKTRIEYGFLKIPQ